MSKKGKFENQQKNKNRLFKSHRKNTTDRSRGNDLPKRSLITSSNSKTKQQKMNNDSRDTLKSHEKTQRKIQPNSLKRTQRTNHSSDKKEQETKKNVNKMPRKSLDELYSTTTSFHYPNQIKYVSKVISSSLNNNKNTLHSSYSQNEQQDQNQTIPNSFRESKLHPKQKFNTDQKMDLKTNLEQELHQQNSSHNISKTGNDGDKEMIIIENQNETSNPDTFPNEHSLLKKLNELDSKVNKIEKMIKTIQTIGLEEIKFDPKRKKYFAFRILSQNKYAADVKHVEFEERVSPITTNNGSISSIKEYSNVIKNKKYYSNNRLLIKAILFQQIFKECQKKNHLHNIYNNLNKKWERVISLKEEEKKEKKERERERFNKLMSTSQNRYIDPNIRFFGKNSFYKEGSYPPYDDYSNEYYYNQTETKEIPFSIIADVQPMIIHKRQRWSERFLELNRLTQDPLQDNFIFANLNKWYKSEAKIYWENFRLYRKNFSKIARQLPNKSIKDVILYYYHTKNSKQFKQCIRESRMIKKRNLKRSLIHEGDRQRRNNSISNVKARKRNQNEIDSQVFNFDQQKKKTRNFIIQDDEDDGDEDDGDLLYNSKQQRQAEDQDQQYQQSSTEQQQSSAKPSSKITFWQKTEIKIFVDAFTKYGKDLKKIATLLDRKTENDCLKFYKINQKRFKKLQNKIPKEIRKKQK
ncbi:duplicated homeodomain-like superfamily protein [Anaeramoeba flamelloides]|uniref:Duplicated homeodomain-like superfamily protein n=1 Tax=Anaeramoeba flamelloides TaxID=1746091 RepID=A0ABQ8YW31_9EUKA|nr:duplicated homeodomain-like superfamily protein [Anaeramoeba flamelloides]